MITSKDLIAYIVARTMVVVHRMFPLLVCVQIPISISAFMLPLLPMHSVRKSENDRICSSAGFLTTLAMSKNDWQETSSNITTSAANTTVTADALAALEAIDIETGIDSPVLQNVFPALLQHCRIYGHPNIPLGSTAGRHCETLRRLQIQQKLSTRDVALLQEQVGFRFYSLEQVYETANFEELLERLEAYAAKHDNDWSPPKKYAPDPELGAWVTGVRRVGREKVDPMHAIALETRSGGRFQWTSPRQCGSQFMIQYRALQERLSETKDKNKAVWNDPTVRQWVRAQQEAAKRGTLSETRKHYMAQLLHSSQDNDWIEQERPWESASSISTN